jgi:hypothetical protein
MIENELDKITSEIGGIKEFQSLLVMVHLKEGDNEVGQASPQGHMPSASYINNNVLTLYTSSELSMPAFLIPPPMIRFIEVIRTSGGWGVKLISWEQKIQCVKNVRNAFKAINGNPNGLKEAKELVEAAPVLLIEGLEKSAAEAFLDKVTETDSHPAPNCTLVYNGEVIN